MQILRAVSLELEVVVYMPPAGFKQNFSWKHSLSCPVELKGSRLKIEVEEEIK